MWDCHADPLVREAFLHQRSFSTWVAGPHLANLFSSFHVTRCGRDVLGRSPGACESSELQLLRPLNCMGHPTNTLAHSTNASAVCCCADKVRVINLQRGAIRPYTMHRSRVKSLSTLGEREQALTFACPEPCLLWDAQGRDYATGLQLTSLRRCVWRMGCVGHCNGEGSGRWQCACNG